MQRITLILTFTVSQPVYKMLPQIIFVLVTRLQGRQCYDLGFPDDKAEAEREEGDSLHCSELTWSLHSSQGLFVFPPPFLFVNISFFPLKHLCPHVRDKKVLFRSVIQRQGGSEKFFCLRHKKMRIYVFQKYLRTSKQFCPLSPLSPKYKQASASSLLKRSSAATEGRRESLPRFPLQ